MAVERTAVNPVTWSVVMGFDQGELVSGHTRTLYLSGQTAVSGDGRPRHDGDMAAQLAPSIDNMEAVLHKADMSFANLVRLNVCTTDVDLFLRHHGVLAGRLGAARPTSRSTGPSPHWSAGPPVRLRGTGARWEVRCFGGGPVTTIRSAAPAGPSGSGSRRPAGPSGPAGGGTACGG